MWRRIATLGLASWALVIALVTSSAQPAVAAPPPNSTSWSCYGGNACGMTFGVAPSSAPVRVFYLVSPLAMVNPSVTQGPGASCQQGQPNGQPNEAECFVSGSGAPAGTTIRVAWQSAPISPAAHLQLYLNYSGMPPYDGPFDVPPAGATTPPPTSGGPPQRSEENLIELIFAKAPHRTTGFVGEFRHLTREGLLPDPADDEELDLPSGFDYLGGSLPRCPLGKLTQGARCSSAIIGNAEITAYEHRCTDTLTPATGTPIVVDFTLFNGGPHDIYARSATAWFDVRVSGNRLRTMLPDRFISPLPDICTPITDVKLAAPLKTFKLGAHRSVPGPFKTGACPKSHKWKLLDTIDYTTGARTKTGALLRQHSATVLERATAACTAK